MDVVILLECTVTVAEVLNALNAATGEFFHYSDSPAQMKTIQVFTRFSHQFIRPVEESHRYSIRHLAAPAQTDLLLAVVHFPSKLFWAEDSQVQECNVLAKMIDSAEKRIGHFRTVLVGDLNMNPFEKGVVGTMGLNATMVRSQAQKELRTCDSHQHVTYFWNMFDQVLVRPSLIGKLEADGIQIINSVGSVSLLTTDGRPDVSVGSDHLPLLFSMKL